MGKKVDWHVELSGKEYKRFYKKLNSEFKPSLELLVRGLILMSKDEVKGVSITLKKSGDGKVFPEMKVEELEFTTTTGDKLTITETDNTKKAGDKDGKNKNKKEN